MRTSTLPNKDEKLTDVYQSFKKCLPSVVELKNKICNPLFCSVHPQNLFTVNCMEFEQMYWSLNRLYTEMTEFENNKSTTRNFAEFDQIHDREVRVGSRVRGGVERTQIEP